jgi:formiminotetrahydrofolate cyclodeaminase
LRLPAAGPLAAVVTAEAAAIVAAVARFSGDEAAAAQAESLRERAKPLAAADAEAYVAAAAQLARRTGDDFRLGQALEDVADVLLEIVDAAADVAELAAIVADGCNAPLRPDAVAAATLAEASARAAAHLVEINLVVAVGDERARRAGASVEAAAAAVERARRGGS